MDYESPLRNGRQTSPIMQRWQREVCAKLITRQFNQHYPRMRVLQREIDHVLGLILISITAE